MFPKHLGNEAKSKGMSRDTVCFYVYPNLCLARVMPSLGQVQKRDCTTGSMCQKENVNFGNHSPVPQSCFKGPNKRNQSYCNAFQQYLAFPASSRPARITPQIRAPFFLARFQRFLAQNSAEMDPKKNKQKIENISKINKIKIKILKQ